MDLDNSRAQLYKRLLRETGREGIDNLIEWLENETDFFVAPASTKFHGCYEGGLLQHSLTVYDNLAREIEFDGIESSDSVAIVALLHDICKVNYYTISYRNVKTDKKDAYGRAIWDKEAYYTVDDQFPYGHGEKSVYLISKFIKLSDDEAMAIRWHMGFSDDSFRAGNQSVGRAFDKCPLALFLHIADLKATYIDKV